MRTAAQTVIPELHLTLEAGTRLDLFPHGSVHAHGIPDIDTVIGFVSNRGWGEVELTVEELFTTECSPIGMFPRAVTVDGKKRTILLKVTDCRA